jgi:hypothetical protein
MKHAQSFQDAVQELNTALLPLSRRGFLRTGLSLSAGVAAVAVGGVAWLRRSPRDNLPLPAGISWMSAAQYQVFSRLAPLLLPTAGTALRPFADVPMMAHVDALLGDVAEQARKDLCLGIDLFDNAAVAGHWSRFVDLPDDEALAYLHDWLSSSLMPKRAIAFALTKLTQVAYWMDEGTWAPVEYDGPVTRRLGIPALGNHPLPR